MGAVLRGRCVLVCGWEGAAEAGRRCAASWRRARCAARARGRSGQAPGEAWAATRYAGPAPARRPARPRRDGGDARDRDDVVEPRRAARRRSRARSRARWPRRSCSATPRTSTRPAPRSTSPRSRRRTATTRRASGGGRRRAATDAIVATGGTITHHHAVGADHAPWLRRRDRRARPRRAARAQGALRPGRDHEPRASCCSRASWRRCWSSRRARWRRACRRTSAGCSWRRSRPAPSRATSRWRRCRRGRRRSRRRARSTC